MRNRRQFPRAAAGSALAATTAFAANDNIQIALIGAGGQGSGDARSSLLNAGVRLAVADVYNGRLSRAKELWGDDLFVTRDYREILARPGVDAVIALHPTSGIRRSASMPWMRAKTSTARSRWCSMWLTVIP